MSSRLTLTAAGGLLALLAVGLAGRFLRHAPPAPAGLPAPDPRLTFATPFRNVRPEVRYVGDEACARCHRKLADRYRRHPMGRSVEPAAEAARHERYGPETHNPFEKFGFEYAIERHGDAVVHKETRRDDRGRIAAETAAEVCFALGSGAHGRAYLIERAGYLFQSPINWYAQAGRWDTAPNVTEPFSHAHFFRPAAAACLHCHANAVEPVAHTGNRYHSARLRPIGCERCHGPGELHVRRHEDHDAPAELDDTIVNPKHLEPALREAVCQQCHLQGRSRVERRGRRLTDYRPGLPFEQFWSVFNTRPQAAGEHKAVSHVEQMVASRCYRQSGGKLGCASCHDPHGLPAPEERLAFYRGRCLACHADGDCREKPEPRKQRGDDCTACHMPRVRATDVAHTAASDHRVVRRPGQAPAPPPQEPLVPGVELVPFHRDRLAADDPEVLRDLGVALVRLAEIREEGADGRPLGRAALPLLEAAARRAPDDLPALQAAGYAYWLLDRPDDARRCFEAILAQAPEHEIALMYAAALSAAQKQPEAAAGYYERAVAVNPWSSKYRVGLAQALAARGDWPRAAAACREALKLNPPSLEARKLLVQCLVRAGERAPAREEFDRLLVFFDAEDRDVIRRWFEQLR